MRITANGRVAGKLVLSVDTLARQYWKLKLPGMALLALGLASVVLPNISAVLPNFFDYEIGPILSWISILAGLVFMAHAVQTRGRQKPSRKMLVAFLYLSFGIYLCLFNSSGLVPFTFLFTMFLLIDSLTKFFLASQERGTRATKWGINASLVNVILAMCVATGYPIGGAGWAFGIFFGINLLLLGRLCLIYSATIPKLNNSVNRFVPSAKATEAV